MTATEPRRRIFVALPLPAEQRSILADHLADCAATAPGHRWSKAGNLHLTLHFLGWIEAPRLDEVEAALAGVSTAGSGVGPFRLRLGGAGRFGSSSRPHVLWIGVADGREPLGALAAAVAEVCARAGAAGDDRPYNPHLTLCRVRSSEALPALPDPPALAGWEVASFTLFESRTAAGGVVYAPLHSYPLVPTDPGSGSAQ